ncbi:MAG: hypothetical protein IJ532_04405 [Alphaproteobacteria bacterium]|nr:hypothetical protein [Alphaproteobacteria bacterium]
MGRYENCTYFSTLYDAVGNSFPQVDRENARTILREVILAPDDYTVEFEDTSYNKKQMMDLIARALIGLCISGSPQETFERTIEKVADIIKHMNDGYITTEDAAERRTFLEDAARNEFDLFTAYALRQACGEFNSETLHELKLNIIRLREFQDLVENYTRNEIEVEVSREEFEQARPIYKMLKSLQNLGYDYNFSPRERESLDIDHEDDEDLGDDFNYANWLKRLMLLQLRKEISATQITTSDFINIPSSNAVLPSKNNDLEAKIAQLRGTYDKRRFDSKRFIMLEQSKEQSPMDGDNQ